MNRRSNLTIVAGVIVALLGAVIVLAHSGGASDAGSNKSAAAAGAAGEAAGVKALEVPPGRNAVAFSLPVPQGVARYVEPGALINVFATFKGTAVGPEATATTTKIILSNVSVLANKENDGLSGKDTPVTGGGEVLLTLALTPDEAEKMIYARENGTLWFGLVHPGDAPAATAGRTPRSELR